MAAMSQRVSNFVANLFSHVSYLGIMENMDDEDAFNEFASAHVSTTDLADMVVDEEATSFRQRSRLAMEICIGFRLEKEKDRHPFDVLGAMIGAKYDEVRDYMTAIRNYVLFYLTPEEKAPLLAKDTWERGEVMGYLRAISDNLFGSSIKTDSSLVAWQIRLWRWSMRGYDLRPSSIPHSTSTRLVHDEFSKRMITFLTSEYWRGPHDRMERFWDAIHDLQLDYLFKPEARAQRSSGPDAQRLLEDLAKNEVYRELINLAAERVHATHESTVIPPITEPSVRLILLSIMSRVTRRLDFELIPHNLHLQMTFDGDNVTLNDVMLQAYGLSFLPKTGMLLNGFSPDGNHDVDLYYSTSILFNHLEWYSRVSDTAPLDAHIKYFALLRWAKRVNGGSGFQSDAQWRGSGEATASDLEMAQALKTHFKRKDDFHLNQLKNHLSGAERALLQGVDRFPKTDFTTLFDQPPRLDLLHWQIILMAYEEQQRLDRYTAYGLYWALREGSLVIKPRASQNPGAQYLRFLTQLEPATAREICMTQATYSPETLIQKQTELQKTINFNRHVAIRDRLFTSMASDAQDRQEFLVMRERLLNMVTSLSRKKK